MPRNKGKRNKGKKSKSTKSPNKSKSKSQHHHKKSKENKPAFKREGCAFSKEILPLLNQLTAVLREVDELKGNPLYETAIKLDELSDKIIALQSGGSKHRQIWGFEDTQSTDAQIILNRLSLWIQSQQKDTFLGDKFEFAANLAEGRGVIAAKDLLQGEHTMSIHRKLMITHSFAVRKSDDKIRRFLNKDPLCKQVASLAMVLFIWFERIKGKKSFWKPYIDALPQSFGLPHESSIAELIPFLSGSLILDKIIRLKISHLRHYTYARQMLQRAGIEPGLRLSDYLWAAGVIMTRQNRIPCAENNNLSEIALIPAWDFCNYCSGRITSYFNTKCDKNEMFAMKDTKKGEQIYIYYGSQRNELLYLNSGFVFDDNPNDELEIDLRLDAAHDPLYKIKLLQVKNANLSSPLKCLLPIVNHEKYKGQHIELQVKIENDEAKKEMDRKQAIKHVEIFEDNDISTRWMLSVFESLGLSIASACIRFARISQMNKEELMQFMHRFYNKEKKKEHLVVQEEKVVDLENVDADDDDANRVQNIEDIGEPKELISIENELKAWNFILNKAKKMQSFFTEKLKICVDVHIDGKKELNSKQVVLRLREMNKDHVALSFKLLDIERNHYEKIVETMIKGIEIIQKRMKDVLNDKQHCFSVN